MINLSDVSVVILCFNRKDEVELNVPPRIQDAIELGLELIVVDNNSSDGTREYLKNLYTEYPCFKLLLNDRNLGVGAGRNTGWEKATKPYIVTLDEDTHITLQQLYELCDALHKFPNAGIMTPIMYHPSTNALQVKILKSPYQVTTFHGACYVTRKSVITSVGFHDPECDFGGEELDLSIRARNYGWDVLQVPNLMVAHNARQRGDSGVSSLDRRLRWTRNHARVVWRWFPYHHAIIWGGIMLASQLKNSLRHNAFREIPVLISAWLSGAFDGAKLHQTVRASVSHFYVARLGIQAFFRKN